MMALPQIEHPETRDNMFVAYIKNSVAFLKHMHPEVSDDDIETFVKQLVQQRCDLLRKNLQAAKQLGDIDKYCTGDQMRWPTCKVVFSSAPDDRTLSHSYGNYTEIEDFPLFDLSRKYRNKIIAPSGTFYETSDVHKSFIATMVNNKKKARSIEKKAMLLAKNCNDKVGETFHNKKQSTIKIKMNSLPGACGSGSNLYSSVPNYNAITSIARFCIQNAYAHAERFLEANFYFRTEEQAVNHVILCQVKGPIAEDTMRILTQYNLKVPSSDEVYDFLARCIKRYSFETDFPVLKQVLADMSPGVLSFIYYMSNMKHLVFNNEAYFRPWISEIMLSEEQILTDVDLDKVDEKELFKMDGDMLIMLSTFYNHIMPLNPKSGNTITPYETLSADYNRVDVAKKLVVLGHHVEQQLNKIQPLFDHFMQHDVGIGYVSEHKTMFRDCTILSDTDSIIFTTKTWVQWYNRGKLTLDTTAYNINTLVVYWLSKANANILYHLGKILGACGKDIFILNMKNEFMMPIEILTSLKKHYVSVLKIQEGVFYNTPKLDIKGVGFRGSNLCRSSLNYAEWFIHEAINDISQTTQLSIYKFIKLVLQFERLIYDDLKTGHTQYLTVAPIKEKNEYADDEKSIYFNYRFWEDVFGDKYGNILPPVKCFILPLINVRSQVYLDNLSKMDSSIYDKMVKFLKDNTKDITRIPINPQSNLIPPELRGAINYKSVIYNNCGPLYLLMKSFGINTGAESKHCILFSDIYGWVTEESGKEALQHV